MNPELLTKDYLKRMQEEIKTYAYALEMKGYPQPPNRPDHHDQDLSSFTPEQVRLAENVFSMLRCSRFPWEHEGNLTKAATLFKNLAILHMTRRQRKRLLATHEAFSIRFSIGQILCKASGFAQEETWDFWDGIDERPTLGPNVLRLDDLTEVAAIPEETAGNKALRVTKTMMIQKQCQDVIKAVVKTVMVPNIGYVQGDTMSPEVMEALHGMIKVRSTSHLEKRNTTTTCVTLQAIVIESQKHIVRYETPNVAINELDFSKAPRVLERLQPENLPDILPYIRDKDKVAAEAYWHSVDKDNDARLASLKNILVVNNSDRYNQDFEEGRKKTMQLREEEYQDRVRKTAILTKQQRAILLRKYKEELNIDMDVDQGKKEEGEDNTLMSCADMLTSPSQRPPRTKVCDMHLVLGRH